jgi:phage FluMu gp28-like protein
MTNTSLPSLLTPYQQRWVADNSPVKAGEKGRRTGLTWAEAGDDVLIASADKTAGGQNVYYVGTDKEMTEEYIQACGDWCRLFNRAASEISVGLWNEGNEEDRAIKTFRINFPNSGFSILALASRPRKLRGRQGVLIADEAAFQDDLAGLLKAGMAFLLWGGKVRVISTHDGDANPFNQFLEEIRAGKRKGSIHKITFRDAVAEGIFKRICLRTGQVWSQEAEDNWVKDIYSFYGSDAEEELDVIPSKGGGVYLSMGMILSRMSKATPIVRMEWKPEFSYESEEARFLEVQEWCIENLLPVLKTLDPARGHALGGDYGRVGDLTVYPILEEGKDLVRRCKLWIELGHCPYRQQEQIFNFIVDNLPRFKGAALDAGGIGSTLAEFARQKYGSLIEQVHLSESFYSAEMPKFKAAFEDGLIDDIPQDDEIRDDLRAIKKIDGVPKLPKSKSQTKSADGKRVQRHGDGAIALLLANRALSKDSAPIEFESTGVHREGLGAFTQSGKQFGSFGADESDYSVRRVNDFDSYI